MTTDSEGLVPVAVLIFELVAPPLFPPPGRFVGEEVGADCFEVKEETIDEEIDEALVTGQTVVVRSMTLVTRIVDTAPDGSEVRAAVSLAAGHLVTVGAQEMIVETEVTLTVRVVKPAPAVPFKIVVVLANGGKGRVVLVLAAGGSVVIVGMMPLVVVLLTVPIGTEVVTGFLLVN